ncbi:MAG TPA: hypothetical protein VGZ48_11090 [Candidatus Acidoferrales bacterium]|jgi:hypothetical protein|nr:hypothetical protein [Candidatus Acidoferrales bacterium]
MFLGHFGVALAAKKIAPRTSLGTLFLAAQFADLTWPIFLLLGWETVQIDPGSTRVTPLNFTSYPISHSLLAEIGFGIALGLVYYALRRKIPGASRAAIVIAACVPSHWILDWIVHRPDLPLTPWSRTFHGLNLWSSVPITLVLEFAIYGLGIAIYLGQTTAKDAIGRYAFWALIFLLSGAWLASVFGPPPSNPQVLAFSALAMWITIPWSAWADRHRALN